MRSSWHQSRIPTTLARRAWILDVGHGNSTVVEEPGYVSVIDGGQGPTLLRFLSDRGINRVDTIIVSHADADHFGGVSLLLSDRDFEVGRVFVNPDARRTALWEDFRAVMTDAKARGAEFFLELNSVHPGQLTSGGSRLEVLAPSQELAVGTADGLTRDGRRLTPNSMSAVVRVWSGDSPCLLIAGDIDQVGLDSLIGGSPDIRADVLVFPHHGGLPGGSDPDAFAGSLARAVGAQLVVFSIGRGRYGTPRPEIVAAVQRGMGGTHIACTQLSEHCAADLPSAQSDMHAAVSRGAAESACCAGTIEVSLEREHAYVPTQSAHIEFIRQNAPTALCWRHGPSTD